MYGTSKWADTKMCKLQNDLEFLLFLLCFLKNQHSGYMQFMLVRLPVNDVK